MQKKKKTNKLIKIKSVHVLFRTELDVPEICLLQSYHTYHSKSINFNVFLLDLWLS